MMTPLSAARQFFDYLVSGGASSIESLVTERQHETEWLDFKNGIHLQKEAETWSRAICGFANNQGGVVIWGIDARKDPITNVDAACGFFLVENPELCRSNLMEEIRGAVEPPVTGIEVREFFENGSTGPGFVVCFVPESQNKPHRDERATNKPYTIRIGESFINPSPSLLRNLFYPKSTPALQVDVVPQWNRLEGPLKVLPEAMAVQFHVMIRNIGVVSARDVHVVIRTVPDLPIMGPYSVVVSSAIDNKSVTLKNPLHPLDTTIIAYLRCQAAAHQVAVGAARVWTPRVEGLQLTFDVFAADMMRLRLECLFGGEDVDSHTKKTALSRLDEK